MKNKLILIFMTIWLATGCVSLEERKKQRQAELRKEWFESFKNDPKYKQTWEMMKSEMRKNDTASNQHYDQYKSLMTSNYLAELAKDEQGNWVFINVVTTKKQLKDWPRNRVDVGLFTRDTFSRKTRMDCVNATIDGLDDMDEECDTTFNPFREVKYDADDTLHNTMGNIAGGLATLGAFTAHKYQTVFNEKLFNQAVFEAKENSKALLSNVKQAMLEEKKDIIRRKTEHFGYYPGKSDTEKHFHKLRMSGKI